jgi:hypothetical protein
VVRDFCGHGVGASSTRCPISCITASPGYGLGLKPGMFFTVEPMINLGGYGVKVLNDGWTAVTRDRSLSAQFEHSVGVTEDGVEIFTRSPKGWDKPPLPLTTRRESPHYFGHRERLRARFLAAGARRHAGLRNPRTRADDDSSPARRETARKGADGEIRRLRRRDRSADRTIDRNRRHQGSDRDPAQGDRSRRSSSVENAASESPGSELLERVARLLRGRDGTRAAGGIPRPVSRPQECVDRRRSPKPGDGRSYARLSARDPVGARSSIRPRR